LIYLEASCVKGEDIGFSVQEELKEKILVSVQQE
jgi:hypothetical protein